MSIPSVLTFYNYSFNTLLLFFIAAYFVFSFVLWLEGRHDGFDDIKLLDFTFLYTIIAILLHLSISFIIFKYIPREINPIYILFFIIVISLIICVSLFWRLWHWSWVRLLDIFMIAIVHGLVVISIGYFILYPSQASFLPFFALTMLTFATFWLRKIGITSGMPTILIAFILIGLDYYRFKFFNNLLFYIVLIIIDLVHLFFRIRVSLQNGFSFLPSRPVLLENDESFSKSDNNMSKYLPINIIEDLKKRLKSKEKRLKEEQRLLGDEDPYKEQDRLSSNEEIDDALLEDSSKELVDMKQSAINLMQIQVKKALAALRLGKYGICEICGKPIDKARLKAYPEATRCLNCAQKS